MNEKQCSFAPSGQQYVFEYRVAGLQLGQDIPFFTTVTLPMQEEPSERSLFVDGTERAAIRGITGVASLLRPWVVIWRDEKKACGRYGE